MMELGTDFLPMSTPIIELHTLTPKTLKWVWRPRLPAGRLSILVGHPDRGKSLFAVMCAAHVSRGTPWPDGQRCPQGKVVFLEAEDSLEETTLPRLIAAGADLSHVVTWVERGLHPLPAYLRSVHAVLAIISPLNTYLPRINTWVDQEVRKMLQPLADLADATGTAILGIMHPPKTKQGLPIHMIAGSVAFGAVARSVIIVERGEDSLHLVEGIKQNLAQPSPPIGYRLQSWEKDPDVGQLTWELVPEKVSLLPPDDEQGELAHACDFVRMMLSHGPMASTAMKYAADNNGLAWRTVMRSRKVLQVEARQVYDGAKSHWELSLPQTAK